MNIRFDGKTVAVTGAGHGFGRCIAQTFAHLGARVFATDILAEELAETAADGGITTKVVDLRDRAAGAAWIRQIEMQTGGPISVLINNAGGVGGQGPRPLEEVSDEDWNVLFDINVERRLRRMPRGRTGDEARRRRAHRQHQLRRRAATLAHRHPGLLRAKHAVVGLTRQLAHEFGLTTSR